MADGCRFLLTGKSLKINCEICGAASGWGSSFERPLDPLATKTALLGCLGGASQWGGILLAIWDLHQI